MLEGMTSIASISSHRLVERVSETDAHRSTLIDSVATYSESCANIIGCT